MVLKFEQTGSMSLNLGRGRKPVDVTAVKSVAIELNEESSSVRETAVHGTLLDFRHNSQFGT